MKKFMAMLIIFNVTLAAQANCIDIFKRDLDNRAQKLKRSKLAGRITYPTTTVVAGGLASIGPVAAYGTLGFFVGASTGLLITAPIAATFLTINGVRKARIKSITQAYLAIEHAYGNISLGSGKALTKMLKRVKKSKPTYNQNELKQKLIELNEKQTLCDGTIKKSLPGLKAIAKFIARTK